MVALTVECDNLLIPGLKGKQSKTWITVGLLPRSTSNAHKFSVIQGLC
jgi:hypothetical protein